MKETSLAVAEMFGPTFQGEGPSMGRRCSFLRLSGCNLRCLWCDTPYTWDWSGLTGHVYTPGEESQVLDVDAVRSWIAAQHTDMLVVTGGEPLLQQRVLTPLLRECADRGLRIEVETAGTIAPLDAITQHVSQFNVSPKLANSGNPLTKRLRPEALDRLQEVDDLVSQYHLFPIYVMPEGTSADTVLARSRELADPVLARGWNLTSRLHILLYGNRRGV
jgi:organic radical activating enzyme